jgi:hypothetical protein
MITRLGWLLSRRTLVALMLAVCMSTTAQAQMSNGQARSYLGYKLPQIVDRAWQLYSASVAQIGTQEERAALARLRLIFDKDDYGAPAVTVRCSGIPCALRINASFTALSLVFALSSAASIRLKAAPGAATQCFIDNVDSLASSVQSASGNGPYFPLLSCLGKTDIPLQQLIDDKDYNDFADIAAIETLAFAFTHELAHVKNGDLKPGSESRNSRDVETQADVDAVEFLARGAVDSFFGAGAMGVFRLHEKLGAANQGDYPPTRCRILYAMFSSGYFLIRLDRSKLKYSSPRDRQLRSEFLDWKILESAAFVGSNIAKAKDGSCGAYFK